MFLSSWDLPRAIPVSLGDTTKAPVIEVCFSFPPQIPEGASLAMSLSDKKDTTLSRGRAGASRVCWQAEGKEGSEAACLDKALPACLHLQLLDSLLLGFRLCRESEQSRGGKT